MSLDFVILGAQKAATSALQLALRKHPHVYMPEGESAFFEDPDFASRPWETFGQDLPDTTLTGIKRPDCLCSDQAILRISTAVPQARFIVVLREPISRAVSSYCHLVRHAHLPALPLNEGLARCLDAFEKQDVAGRAATVLDYGLYGRYLEKWYAAFPKDRFLVLSHKQISGQPDVALRKVAAHLGIAPEPLLGALQDGSMTESNTGLYDPAMLRLARLGSLLKTRPIPGTSRRIPRAALPLAAGGILSQLAETLARLRGQDREALSEDIRDRMEEIYAADLADVRANVPAEVLYWDRAGT